MAITYPLTMPTSHFRTLKVRQRTAASTPTSPLSFAQDVQDWGGQRWELDIGLVPMTESEAQEWITFFLKLNGPVGYFIADVPGYSGPQGAWSGTPLVNGAQTGATLVIDGATASVTNWAVAGDFFHIDDGSGLYRLHKVLENANSDGSGNVSLEIWPAIRGTTTNNDPLVSASPKGAFRLAGQSPEWTIGEDDLYRTGFSAVERLNT